MLDSALTYTQQYTAADGMNTDFAFQTISGSTSTSNVNMRLDDMWEFNLYEIHWESDPNDLSAGRVMESTFLNACQVITANTQPLALEGVYETSIYNRFVEDFSANGVGSLDNTYLKAYIMTEMD